MNNKNILFINPLGWDNNIWDKVTKDKYFKNKNIQFVSFLGSQYKKKDQSTIFLELDKKIKMLDYNITIVAASYGVKILLLYLKNKCLNKNLDINLLLIDGLEIVPNKNILREILLDTNVKEQYISIENYLEDKLTEDELNDNFYKNLMLSNIQQNNENKFEVITKNRDLYHYLLYVEEIDNVENLSHIVEFVKEISIFDTIKISDKKLLSKINYFLLNDDHLMMLGNEQKIISEIKKLNN